MRVGAREWKFSRYPYEFYVLLKYWGFGRTMRMNGSLMWGYSPYLSYRFGPFELRKYLEGDEQ